MACDQLDAIISDNRKMVLFSHTFTFTITIQVNKTDQFVRKVAAALPTCKQICF